MKKLAFAIIVLIAFSCNQKSDKESEVIRDNEELVEIYKEDQADRQTQPIDWTVVSKRDSLREVRIYELLDSNKVRTSLDYHNAAMIFQQVISSSNRQIFIKQRGTSNLWYSILENERPSMGT
jgi:hypothetical protein